MFVSSPCSFSRRRTGTAVVEALAGDEARGAEAEAVALHEALHARAVRGGQDQAAEDAHQPCQAATIRSTSTRSSSVRPRSGAHTSAETGTPRRPSTVFERGMEREAG